MLGRMRTITAALTLMAASAAPGARADVLHVLSSTGLLRAVDPATGTVLQRTRLQAPGKVVTGSAGLGAVPGGGAAYGLLRIADDCALDPTRTFVVGRSSYGCEYTTSQEACDQAFVVTWDDQPVSCAWEKC